MFCSLLQILREKGTMGRCSMENFLIGHYGAFDREKQKRDYRDSFWGIEACMMKSEAEILALHRHIKSHQINLGIHFPLRANLWISRDPQYLSNNEDVRTESYAYMEKEFEYAGKLNPDYILVHWPKPVVLDERVEWLAWKWRFAHESEYCYLSDMNIEVFESRTDAFFSWFSAQAQKHAFKPVIELDAIPPYVYEGDLLNRLLKKYPDIKIFADIGRLHFQQKIDSHFDSFKFLESIVPFLSGIHLWNIKVTDSVSYGHYPALPSLRVEEGWADVKRYFQILNKSENHLKILFEHQSNLVSDKELADCYEWISKLYKQSTSNDGLK